MTICTRIALVALPLFLGLLAACKPEHGATAETPAAAPAQAALPYMSREDINALFTATDKVDIIFYDLPVSVSQDDATSAKNTVTYISPLPPPAEWSCPAVGRLSWISGGAIIKEANVHIDSVCAYLVFVQQEQPVASNVMGPAGQQFFRSVISQARQRMGQ
jgi:hypothetical protein